MSAPTPSGSRPPLQQRREEIIAALSRRFAGDELSLDDFEQRLDGVVRAGSLEELEAVVSDLPAVGRASDGLATPPAWAGATPADRARRQYVIAVMGGNTRAGSWVPARKILSYAFWGGAELDFREAQLQPGLTEIIAIGIMGGVDIIVPPEVGVEVGGFALMGGLDHVHHAPPADPSAPRIKVTGFALMGGVEVSVRYPGESAGQARRRRKAEERERRLERRRRRELPGG